MHILVSFNVVFLIFYFAAKITRLNAALFLVYEEFKLSILIYGRF